MPEAQRREYAVFEYLTFPCPPSGHLRFKGTC